MSITPSAQYRLTIRLRLDDTAPGAVGHVTGAIGEAGGVVVGVDLVEADASASVRDIVVDAANREHWGRILEAIEAIGGVEVVDTTDRTFLLHVGGKIEQRNKHSLKTRDDLSMVYTPGVARVCIAIRDDPEKASQYTIKRNTVAVVSDGTAVLGLGDIGPAAAMPVMEGKACLFKEFAGVDAFPICLDTKDPDEIVRTVKLMAPGFGGINLEDISAPRCFEIEERLQQELDIPVFHDDQHGTAVVVMAALLNAVKLTGRQPGGPARAGASASARRGSRSPRSCARRACATSSAPTPKGRCTCSREDYLDGSMNPVKRWFAEVTNPECRAGAPADVIDGADLLIGVSGARALPAQALARMNDDAMVFAMANPNPEVDPRGGGAVRADHGDRALGLPQPDQQRAVLPGDLPRGAGRARAGDHRGDEDGRRARDRGDRPRGGAARGLHNPLGLQPRRGARGGGGGRRASARQRHGAGRPGGGLRPGRHPHRERRRGVSRCGSRSPARQA